MEYLFADETNHINSDADRIIKNILSSTKLFKNRIPKNTNIYPKSYQRICKILTDIHDGVFLSNYILDNRHIALDEKTIRYTLDVVKYDWDKVENLIKRSLDNFVLMHDIKYMPYSKKYLHDDLSLYLYDYYHQDSQFIQCLEKPMTTSAYKSELKADKIFNSLDDDIKEIGNNIIDLSSYSNSASFWQFISDMHDWSLLLLRYDKNSHYFVSSPHEFISKFYNFIVSSDLILKISNFKYMLQSNNPLNWFIKDAIRKHNIDKKVINCFSKNDFEGLQK